jgi:nucleotide-binding universal stress UspA family protein
MMKTRILVPLDGSPLAEQALSCAITVGRGLSAELVLFRAIPLPWGTGKHIDVATAEEGELLGQLEAEAKTYLRQLGDQVQLAGPSVQIVVHHGPAAETIVDYAEQADIGQIIMATHGYSGIRRWTHGSVAERVLQAASVPVLLVRAREQDAEVFQQLMLCRRILVPLDGSDIAEQVLPQVRPLARAIGAEVVLLRVAVEQPATMISSDWFFVPGDDEFEDEEQKAQVYLDDVAASLRGEGIQVSTATDVGPVAGTIIDYAQANHIDLIAMCTHGRTGLARWAFGSVADKVLRAGSTPILLVRAR